MSCVTESSACPDGYRELSAHELHELLRDDDKMEQVIRINQKFQELQLERENLQTSNRSLAERSLTQRPRLDAGKLQLSHKYRQLSELTASCWEKQSMLEARGHSLQSAQNRLQEAVAQAEEQSEDLLERFMEGALPLDDFLDSFQRSRRTCHIRRAQTEKLQELMRAGRSTADPPSSATAPPQDTRDCDPDPHRPNGLLPQGPLRVFQVRYGLTPAILVPHYPVSPTGPAPAAPAQPPAPPPSSGHAPAAVGLRLIGQLPGGWPSGRPVRVQQLYRPSPAHTEPPCR